MLRGGGGDAVPATPSAAPPPPIKAVFFPLGGSPADELLKWSPSRTHTADVFFFFLRVRARM